VQHTDPTQLEARIGATEALLKRARDTIHRSTLLLVETEEELLRAREHLQSNLGNRIAPAS
jgi:hypothetical protein